MHGIRQKRDFCLILISLFVIAVTVLPFFILCRYNHPGDNDNWWIFRSFLDQRAPYISFKSLFAFRGTFNFVNLFFLPIYNHPEGMTEAVFSAFLTIYHLSAAFYVLLFWLSSSTLYHALNKAFFHFKGSHALFFYALYLYLVFNAIHYPTMAFYDLVSSSGYNAGLSYLFFFLSFSLLHYGAEGEKGKAGKKRILQGAVCIVFFIACIFSMEYYPFVCGCFSFAFILYDACVKRRFNLLHALFLTVCLAVFFRNFLIVRNSIIPDADGYVGKYTGGTDSGLTLAVTLKTMLQSLRENSIRYFRQLVSQRRYLPAVALLTGGIAVSLRTQGKKLPLPAVLPFFLIIVGMCAVFSFATPDLFVMPRYAWTPFVLLCFFILALLTGFILLLLTLFDKGLASDQTGDFLRVRDGVSAAVRIFLKKTKNGRFLIAATAFAALLFSWCALKDANSCVAWAWKDILKGEAAAYNREMNDRYTAIFSAEAGEPVYLVPILHRPVSLFVRDSMEFEGDRICCSDFFDNDNIYFKVGDLIMR